jgi:hypothetical protein
VQELVSDVASGKIRLPDIQRPFVWTNAKVRDLIDSMFRGYPVGELMFWENQDPQHTRGIGRDPKTQAASMQVVDGQQRLTSLFAVVKGVEVVRDNYSREKIVISFNPLTERFAVPDNATGRSPEWVHDIRTVFESAIDARGAYLEGLERARGERPDQSEERAVEIALNNLNQLLRYAFQVVQIRADVDREVVADVFVRINSEGVTLTAPDFILTWLSVFWEQGRAQLDEFARTSRFTPAELTRETGKSVLWSPRNPYLVLEPGQILRVGIAVGMRRAKLQDAYNVLRGRDPRTRQIVPALRSHELARLQSGQEQALKPNNWDEYLRVLERAGIRTSSMITAKNTVLYGYALWLLGRTEYGVAVDELREVMARWFFMAQITGRYSGSPETRGQEDLNRLEGLAGGDAAGFIAAIRAQIDATLTEDWWLVSFPEDLHTSNTFGPAYVGYVAALTILDAEVLLATSKVKDWLEPGRRPVKGVEKHHLFPQDYLRTTLGMTSARMINQVANQALVEWSDNIDISNFAPADYWPRLVADKAIGETRLRHQMWWHALPDRWIEMGYDEFLTERRRLIADITHEGFRKLSDPNYQPAPTSTTTTPRTAESAGAAGPLRTFEALVRDQIVPAGTLLTPVDSDKSIIAEVTEDGSILLDEQEYPTPDLAARAAAGEETDGWGYWAAEFDGGPVPLVEVRMWTSTVGALPR